MIKRADDNNDFYPDLVSAKPRGGIQPVSRLVELLIKQYEIQDQLREQKVIPQPSQPAPIAEVKTDRATQATFSWFE